MKVKFKFKNGQQVRDMLTGLEGTIDCCALWLNGCRRYSVQPRCKESEMDKKPESWWMDEEQLELIGEGLSKKVKPSKTGGPSFKSDSAR